MDISNLIKKINNLPESLLSQSGKILYSSVETLKKGDIYFLGYNPGGEIDYPVKRDLQELPHRVINAYLDEEWVNRIKKYPNGEHPLQINCSYLIRALGYEPREVFCTNLIFVRSRSQELNNYNLWSDICWDVHREFIKIVDPKYFIVFGNSNISPFRYIKEKYSLSISDSIFSGHGNWYCYSCFGSIEGKERLLIGLPHLSRYYVRYHDDVIRWIKSKFR